MEKGCGWSSQPASAFAGQERRRKHMLVLLPAESSLLTWCGWWLQELFSWAGFWGAASLRLLASTAHGHTLPMDEHLSSLSCTRSRHWHRRPAVLLPSIPACRGQAGVIPTALASLLRVPGDRNPWKLPGAAVARCPCRPRRSLSVFSFPGPRRALCGADSVSAALIWAPEQKREWSRPCLAGGKLCLELAASPHQFSGHSETE